MLKSMKRVQIFPLLQVPLKYESPIINDLAGRGLESRKIVFDGDSFDFPQ